MCHLSAKYAILFRNGIGKGCLKSIRKERIKHGKKKSLGAVWVRIVWFSFASCADSTNTLESS